MRASFPLISNVIPYMRAIARRALKGSHDCGDMDVMLRRPLMLSWVLCVSILIGVVDASPGMAKSATRRVRSHHVSKVPTTDRAGGRGGGRDHNRSDGKAKENSAFKTRDAASHLIWSDEFNGPAGSSPDPNNWNFDTGGKGWGNEELESYTSSPQNSALDGKGDLVITARDERYTGTDGIARQYTSARLQTRHKFQFQYGLIEARIQVPAGKGLWPSFWLLGNEGYDSATAWPDCGEIDAMEVLGSEPNIVYGTLHAPWPWASKDGVGGKAQSSTPLSAGFHIYGVEWAPERISFLLDGVVYKTITPSDLPPGAAWPFDHPYFLLLNLAVGGDWPGSPNASTQFPAHMTVDWVRVWQ
jgi:beta-glucanase (GH16 family)